MINVLLVEDDGALAGSLADYLSEVGFEVDFAFNGAVAIEQAARREYDAIVMDIGMPGVDGLAACRAMRERHHVATPVVFLTARDALADKLEGFRAGGDDYLVKPIDPQELAFRLRAIARRGKLCGAGIQRLGELVIDHAHSQALRDGIRVELSEIPFRLLSELAQAAPLPVFKARLEDRIWSDARPGSEPLRTHIYRLRQALDVPFERPLLMTVHRIGYRLAIPD